MVLPLPFLATAFLTHTKRHYWKSLAIADLEKRDDSTSFVFEFVHKNVFKHDVFVHFWCVLLDPDEEAMRKNVDLAQRHFTQPEFQSLPNMLEDMAEDESW